MHFVLNMSLRTRYVLAKKNRRISYRNRPLICVANREVISNLRQQIYRAERSEAYRQIEFAPTNTVFEKKRGQGVFTTLRPFPVDM